MDLTEIQSKLKTLAADGKFDIMVLLGKVATDDGITAIVAASLLTRSVKMVGHHLHELEKTGLVEGKRSGRYVLYKAKWDVVREVLTEVQELLLSKGQKVESHE